MRVYRYSGTYAAKTTATTLVTIEADAKPLYIIGVSVTNEDNETNEQWPIEIARITTVGSLAGSAVTAEKDSQADAAATAIILGVITTEPDAYNATPYDYQGIPSLVGYRFDPPEDARPFLFTDEIIGVRLRAVIAATNLRWTVALGEL